MTHNDQIRRVRNGLSAVVAILFVLLTVLSMPAGGRGELEDVRMLEIADIDIGQIPDGSYEGSYSYSTTRCAVRVHVLGGTISAIDVLEGSETKHGLEAREVLDRVVNDQRTNVDAVSGATTTSKALLKAVETALTDF